ncbi:MAG: hypothetical protein KC912_16585 [Proteobacteria bacterium]|nr:hypothetical protein [Pseudomonadota bacterium]
MTACVLAGGAGLVVMWQPEGPSGPAHPRSGALGIGVESLPIVWADPDVPEAEPALAAPSAGASPSAWWPEDVPGAYSEESLWRVVPGLLPQELTLTGVDCAEFPCLLILEGTSEPLEVYDLRERLSLDAGVEVPDQLALNRLAGGGYVYALVAAPVDFHSDAFVVETHRRTRAHLNQWETVAPDWFDGTADTLVQIVEHD